MFGSSAQPTLIVIVSPVLPVILGRIPLIILMLSGVSNDSPCRSKYAVGIVPLNVADESIRYNFTSDDANITRAVSGV